MAEVLPGAQGQRRSHAFTWLRSACFEQSVSFAMQLTDVMMFACTQGPGWNGHKLSSANLSSNESVSCCLTRQQRHALSKP